MSCAARRYPDALNEFAILLEMASHPLVLITSLPCVQVGSSACVENRRMVRSLALVQVLRCYTFVHNEGDCWVLICTSKRPINCEKFE